MTEGLSLLLQLKIELHSAAHIGTGLGLGQLLDDRVVQGPHPDYPNAIVPYIPGSSLKGRLRYHLRQLAAIFELPDAEVRLFGSPAQPGALRFADAHLSDLALVAQLVTTGEGETMTGRPSPLGEHLVRGARSFVALSRGRRVARNERLFRIELAEAGLAFVGTVSGVFDAPEPRQELALLLASARVLSHLGGHKGRGLGHCSISIEKLVLNNEELRLNNEAHPWQTLLKELP